ncbi:MAG: retron St85 family RNA-directed DNA polymerase [Desulfovibrio sp.]
MSIHLNLIPKLSIYLGCNESETVDYINKYHRWYKFFSIDKSNGGKRNILHPVKQLKAIQYAIIDTFLVDMPVHKIAHAYIPQKKSPLLTSALRHAQYKYTVRIDFKDFFPSIQPDDLVLAARQHYKLNSIDIMVINKALFAVFNETYGLPIGAPSSPYVSNIIMYDLDEAFLQLAKQTDPQSSITRYADDLYFSTNQRSLCRKYTSIIHNKLKHTKNPFLTINKNKTLYLSKGTKRIVNGLTITPDGRVTIGREKKAFIKSSIYKYCQGRLTTKEILKAKGMIAFLKDCEPSYYDSLVQKFGPDFFSLLSAPISAPDPAPSASSSQAPA